MLNFNHLYYFHVIAAEGSLKRAAEVLGVTQPTLSEQLRSLERSLDTQLFERTTAGLRPTHAGHKVFEQTTQMFSAGARILEALGKAEDPPPVSLRVGMSAATSRTMAADFLMPLLRLERCRPSIRSGELSNLLFALRSHELDLVLGESEPLEQASSNLTTTLISRPTLVAVVSHETAARADWADLKLIEYPASSAFHWESEQFQQDRGLFPSTAGETDDAFFMLEAAAAASCIVAIVPRRLALGAIRAGRVRVLDSFEARSAGVHAIYPSGSAGDLTRSLIENLIEAAADPADAT